MAQYDVNELLIYDFFKYWPSLALACIALSLYTVAAVIVGYLTERRKAHRFVHTVTATGLVEAAGYAALIYAIERSGKSSVFSAYVVMQVFVIEAPNILQMGLYITIGRVLFFSPDLTRGHKLLRGWVIATAFACADLIAIVIQAIGISIWASSQSSGDPDQDQIRLGCGVTLAGLAAQLLFFVCFTVLAIWTHRHPRNGLRGRPETRKLFIGLYWAMGCLYVRNIFRFVEFVQSTVLTWPPPEGTYVLSEQQVLFYTLDCLPILLAFLPYIFMHPGYLLPDMPPKGSPVAGGKPADAAAEASEAGRLGTTELSGSGPEEKSSKHGLDEEQQQFRMVVLAEPTQ
ncbi:hypothetical protein ABPG75_006013 [Micractinium tetrahymenae]